MAAPLKRVLVCSPRVAGWHQPERAARWRELGFHHPPDFSQAQSQHDALWRELHLAGAEVIELSSSADLSLDAAYAHDASLATDFGLILMRPGKKNRVFEGRHQGSFCEQMGIPTFAEITPPGSTEAGDIVWLDAKTLLIGCLHLMSLISLLDEHTALVDLPWLAVETAELLKSRGFEFIEIDYSERDTLACNVLSLGGKRLLAIEENRKTNDQLRATGFDLRTFPGSEICINGSGGPTCLTRPLLRG
jgi:arginine deiminase